MVNPLKTAGEWLTKRGGGVTANQLLEKINTMAGLSYSTGYGQLNQPQPPYQRTFSPLWIYKIRRDSPLMNNAMRQKIWQTFREGFGDWEQEYDAKCPACEHEFEGLDAFREQEVDDDLVGSPEVLNPEALKLAKDALDTADGTDDLEPPEPAGGGEMDPQAGPAAPADPADDVSEADIDLDQPRPCPECEEIVEMHTPDPAVKHEAQAWFDRANLRESRVDAFCDLEPGDQSAIAQSFEEILEEIAWDIQSFDDGWMLFERSYLLDGEGRIVDYELESVQRGPPELLRWDIDEDTNEPGGNHWVCVRCRSADPQYDAADEGGRCDDCGNVLYPALAYATETPAGQGGQPVEWFIRGELYHDSEYERKRYYGYPPVLTLWEEARTMEQMDRWYNDAYEERRAPRGALAVNAAHDAELRQFNRQQMEELREDPNYIPLFLNDHEEEGDPIKFIELLSDPAAMQHMEMREWFLDRIAAHYGVTAVLMEGSPGDSGLSQSMEVEVSEKQAEHFRQILNGFVDAFLAQIGTPGWTRELQEVREDDPEREAQLQGQHLNNAQKALGLGAEVVWTPDDRAEIKPGDLDDPEQGMDMMGMDGGVQGPRGPEPGSLEPGEDPMSPGTEGDRTREGPADEDRPAATPLKAVADVDPEGRVEKIAAAGFDIPSGGEEVGANG